MCADGESMRVNLLCSTYPSQTLAWGECVMAAGNDGKVIFYAQDGAMLQHFDYSKDPSTKEFTCATVNPTGESILVGSFNRFYIFSFNLHRNMWEESCVKEARSSAGYSSISI